MKSRILLLSCILAIALGSCTVKLIANYDNNIASQVESALKMVDKFYLTMLETSKNEEKARAYTIFVQDYIGIEIELQSLLDKNRVRPLNKNSTAIAENTLKQFQKYKEQHKADNYVSDANIILNRMYMHDQLVLLQMGESFKPRE